MRIILNPAARGGAGRRLRREIEQTLRAGGAGFSVVETRAPGDAVALARDAVREGERIVVAAGGDGTIHDVANGILQAVDDGHEGDVALGLIPIGTGNDFAKMVTGAGSRAAALATLIAGKTRPFDVGLASWGGEREYFLNAAGTGIDVEVVRQIQRLSRGTGAMVYVQGLLRALRRYRALPLAITADGEALDRPVLLVAVANGSCVGGSFRITPSAVCNDGRLDLCIVEDLPLSGQLLLIPRVLRGRHASSPHVIMRLVREVTLRVPEGLPLYFQLDGELREPAGVAELHVAIHPARLQVVAQ